MGVVLLSATRGGVHFQARKLCRNRNSDVSVCRHFREVGNALRREGKILTVSAKGARKLSKCIAVFAELVVEKARQLQAKLSIYCS